MAIGTDLAQTRFWAKSVQSFFRKKQALLLFPAWLHLFSNFKIGKYTNTNTFTDYVMIHNNLSSVAWLDSRYKQLNVKHTTKQSGENRARTGACALCKSRGTLVMGPLTLARRTTHRSNEEKHNNNTTWQIKIAYKGYSNQSSRIQNFQKSYCCWLRNDGNVGNIYSQCLPKIFQAALWISQNKIMRRRQLRSALIVLRGLTRVVWRSHLWAPPNARINDWLHRSMYWYTATVPLEA